MTESDLRKLLNTLDASKASLHGWLHFWTFLVIAGVALEVVSLVWEYLKELNDFKHGEIHAPEKPSLLLFAVGFMGIALVVAGVSGELYIDVKTETIETGIRKANDDLLALISKEAGDAKQSAIDAADAAARAKITAGDAEDKSGSAIDKSSDALRQTGNLNSKLDSERTQLEGLDAKRVELEKSIADLTEKIKFRHVSPEQASKITAALLAAAPGVIEIDVLPTAEDGDPYCRDLWDAIHNGGWTGNFGATTLLYQRAHDLFVVTKDWNRPPPGAELLFGALQSAGITVFRGSDSGMADPNAILLIVGPKPK